MYKFLIGAFLLASTVFPGAAMSQQQAPSSTDSVTYIHLAWSGRAFIVRGDTGQEYWVAHDDFPAELQRIRAANGAVLYSREKPDQDPPTVVVENFKLIVALGLPITLSPSIHPHAVESVAR